MERVRPISVFNFAFVYFLGISEAAQASGDENRSRQTWPGFCNNPAHPTLGHLKSSGVRRAIAEQTAADHEVRSARGPQPDASPARGELPRPLSADRAWIGAALLN